VPPLQAAEVAKALGVKVYTVGVGKRKGTVLLSNKTHGLEKFLGEKREFNLKKELMKIS
jgi:hypothetical protein